jgi:5-methylcytosine-specific restriction endonuclease McrA
MTDHVRGTHAYRVLVRQVRREEHVCWLCGQPIDVTLPYRDPITGQVNALSWTLDHVLPLDDYPHLGLVRTNCRAAHHRCNSARGKRPPTRLRPAAPLHTTRRW